MEILREIDRRIQRIHALRSFEGAYLKQINQFFKIETTYSSNAIEGNTHTLEETKVILEDGITIGGKPLHEFYEVDRNLVNIHPFTDGNGRVARLVMNTLLYQDRFFPVSIPLLRRTDYYRLLENNDRTAFGNYIAELELQTIKDVMRFLHLDMIDKK